MPKTRPGPGATATYVAFLRGINVGRAKRIAMADLRKLIGELGYAEVRTLLNSGNAVFTGPPGARQAAAAAIQEAMVVKLGVAARVTVISAEELAAIVAGNPLLDMATDLSRLLAVIVNEPDQLAPLAELAAADWAPEALALGARAVYLWCPNGVLDCRAAVALGKQLGDGMTSRNWNTLCKLQAMCAGQPLA